MSASGEAEVHGSWLGTDCVYDLRSQPYIDYYTFAVDQTADFIIDLEYQGDVVDTYLYLYQMVNGARSILALDDDGGDSTNSLISRTLDPGSHTIGVSTYYAGKTGDYRLHIRQAPSCSVTALPTTGTTVNIYTTWISADCVSTRRPGSHANYYSFTVDGVYSRQVTIDLTSVDADPFLYLIQGDSIAGAGYLEFDDDGGPLNYDSQIISTLLPGPYIIEATTYGGNETGAYTLSVTGHR